MGTGVYGTAFGDGFFPAPARWTTGRDVGLWCRRVILETMRLPVAAMKGDG
ncbi:MAG: hypothetical protein HKN80_06005 [Acidimicrobiia bacterium]|nr:hypothetical protein [Acidimicrobiia bacterium]